MDFLPLFCQLQNKPVLIVGGGEVAVRKARLLLDAKAKITINAPHLEPQLMSWAEQGRLTVCAADFHPELLDGKWLVIAATNQQEVNQQVFHEANLRQIFCNVVDSPAHCSAIMPAIIDRSPLMVAISSAGAAPVLSRQLREKFEAMLPQHLGQLAALAGKLRERVKLIPDKLARRRFWERLFSHERLACQLARGQQQAAEQSIAELLNEQPKSKGSVTLVGAGPGDAGLLTLSGLQQLQQADVVVYDRLVSLEVLALVRRDAERIFVGKEAGRHCVPQQAINQLLLEQAQLGKQVVRLKGAIPLSLAGVARSWKPWPRQASPSRWYRVSRLRRAAPPAAAFPSPTAIMPSEYSSSPVTTRRAISPRSGQRWPPPARLWCSTWGWPTPPAFRMRCKPTACPATPRWRWWSKAPSSVSGWCAASCSSWPNWPVR